MFYIHQTSCISPQKTFSTIDIESLNETVQNKMMAAEPFYEDVPPGVLRRMGKAIRMGVGVAVPIIKNNTPINGIIIGTANGGMEDCIKFLNQIVQYEEGLLAPGNFVQSTNNAIAAQIGLLSVNKAYNCTHVHRGLAFENAVLDTIMQLQEFPGNNYLLGAADEISSFNYNIENLSGAYKTEYINTLQLYSSNTKGSIAGEAAAMFLVNNNNVNAIAKFRGIFHLHSTDEQLVKEKINEFIKNHLPFGESIDMLLHGENGDNQIQKYYSACETLVPQDSYIGHYKHMCGEYPTAGAFGLWLACKILLSTNIPAHIIKKKGNTTSFKNILLYNNYKGYQHGVMLISGC